MLHVPGNLDAGDFLLVPLRKGQNILLGLKLGDRQSCVDEDAMSCGDNVQHGLELFNIGKGLAAGKHKIAPGRDGVHPADAFHDLLQREASHITVFFLVDAERAVILTIVRNEDCDGRAALSGL